MTYNYNKENPIKYHVGITIRAPMRPDKTIWQTMEQEELDKAIGRYTRKHGPPINMSSGGSNVTILEFYNKTEQGFWEITLNFELLNGTNKKEVPVKEDKTIVPPPPPTPQPEQIQALLDAEVITKTNQWGY